MRRVENMMTKWKERHWLENGWVAFDGLLDGRPKERLSEWVAEVAMAPAIAARRQHHYETTAQGPTLSRTEAFLEDHEALKSLLTGPQITEIAAVLLGDDVALLKEKIIYKQPGCAGFAAHQDAASDPAAARRVVCLIAVDPMTPKNGCLEFASGCHNRLLATDDTGCMQPQVDSGLSWEAVPLPVGGMIFFSPLAPHRSAPNGSTWPRRALYLTYKLRSESYARSSRAARGLEALAAH